MAMWILFGDRACFLNGAFVQEPSEIHKGHIYPHAVAGNWSCATLFKPEVWPPEDKTVRRETQVMKAIARTGAAEEKAYEPKSMKEQLAAAKKLLEDSECNV